MSESDDPDSEPPPSGLEVGLQPGKSGWTNSTRLSENFSSNSLRLMELSSSSVASNRSP